MKTAKNLTAFRTRTGSSDGVGRDSHSDLIALFRSAVCARLVDERAWHLHRQGKIPFTISCQGHEAAQVGSASCLIPGKDWVLPYYRDIGVVLTIGMTPIDLALSYFARAADPASGGRQMPCHYSCRRLNIVTGSSPVTTQLLHAAGTALASKIRREDAVSIAYVGEGSTSQGDFHEALNFASIHRLPVIFFCENNGWAISTPTSREMAVENVADRASAYGIPGVVVDGMDLLAVREITRLAVERARKGDGPSLIEAKVARFTPHSSDDDDSRYRPADEVARWRKKDPIKRYRRYLEEHHILSERKANEIVRDIQAEVDAAFAEAEKSALPNPDDLTRHVYAEREVA
jgi:2-oxoisovalerate dehydrogenase E1 component alpha subunit